MIKKFRIKTTVDAFKWDGDADKANQCLGEGFGVTWAYLLGESAIRIHNDEDDFIVANVGEWIIKGFGGRVFVVTEDYFIANYEPINPQP
jgi:hypothetical protein